MICLAIFESSPVKRKLIREWLVLYTLQQNCELEINWIGEDGLSKLEKYVNRMQIALISLDSEKGEACARELYDKNPDCRIMYYRSETCSLVPLLDTRPISFLLWSKGMDSFMDKFDAVYHEVLLSQTTFRYETKSKMYLIPKRNILYFQSDLRYVNICLLQGENPRILAKLSEVEQFAGDGFVRIHKSYLVNPKYVLWMDKKNHSVILSNGEQLPVSDAQYEKACEKLRSVK